MNGRPRKGARERWPCSWAVGREEKWVRRSGDAVAKAVVRARAAERMEV